MRSLFFVISLTIMGWSTMLALVAGFMAGTWLGERAGTFEWIPGILLAGLVAYPAVRFWIWADIRWNLF